MDIVSTSFTHLYGTHHSWLLGLLRRRLNDRWDAADLAHDTFIRILNRPPSETDHLRQRSYLATIATDVDQALYDAFGQRQINECRTCLEAVSAAPQHFRLRVFRWVGQDTFEIGRAHV